MAVNCDGLLYKLLYGIYARNREKSEVWVHPAKCFSFWCFGAFASCFVLVLEWSNSTFPADFKI